MIGDHLPGEIVVTDEAVEGLGDSKRVELGVQVPVCEVIQADRPRGLALVVLHEDGDVDFVRLAEQLGRLFVLLALCLRRELLVIVSEAAKREKLIDELLARVVVRHHDSSFVELRLELFNHVQSVARAALLELIVGYARSKRVQEHLWLEVRLEKLLYHDEYFVEALHVQALVVNLLDRSEDRSEN